MKEGSKIEYTLGADIGGTETKLVLLDENGDVIATSSIATQARSGPAVALGRLVEAVRSLLSSWAIPQEKLTALGIGAAGPLDIGRGTVVQAPNLPGWEGAPIAEIIKGRLGIPVFLENDANLAAFGEQRLGAGQGVNSLVCLTLGTGIGGGVIINGEIFTGGLGAGAELGHITMDLDGPPCACGNRGCLEALASATAVVRMATEALREGRAEMISKLVGGDIGKVTAETVHQAALNGDAVAVEILGRTGRNLGAGIASMVNIFAPRMVVLGGGLMNASPFLLEPARDEAMRRALKCFTEGLSIVPAALGGWAGAIGAACYARHRLKGFTP